MKEESIIKTVTGCSACGEDHKNMEFKFYGPPHEVFYGKALSYWAICPVKQKMIFMTMYEDDQGDDERISV